MKAHLTSSDTQLFEGKTYYAICGARVKNCEFHYFFRDDVSEFSLSISRVNTCDRCYDAQRFLTGRLVYGIVSARNLPESERYEEEAVA